MNRRQFTASLAALAATPALPLGAHAPAVAAPAIPPGAYAWAELIAKAQNRCSPEMLAKILHLSPDVAQVLFKDMVVDGVLQAPGTTGVAKAAQPFDTTGFRQNALQRVKTKAKEVLDQTLSGDERRDASRPLVNTDPPGLGCEETQPEDQTHARTDQHPQENPERG